MQPTPRKFSIVLVLLIAAVILAACGTAGGSKTWFNLPSVPVKLQADGTARVFGINVGSVVQATLINQLETAGVQKLDVRTGSNGVHIYNNGNELPYLAWDNESAANLQDVLQKLPPTLGVPPAAASAIPWLRRIGLGVALHMPGANVSSIPRWSGETTYSKESPPETTIGPFNINSLAFDESGSASFSGVPLASLGAGFALPPMVLDILKSLNAESLSVATQPNGIDLALNGKKLPGIAYDSKMLGNALALAGPFVTDPQMLNTLQSLLPQLPGAAVNLQVSFTGEPIAPTQLAALSLAVGADGSLSTFGLPIAPANTLPADLIANFQAANVQRLDVNLANSSLFLAANGRSLPAVSWNDENLSTLTGILGPLAGVDASTIDGGLTLMRNLTAGSDVGLSLNLPLADGAAPLDLPAASTQLAFAQPNLGDFAPPMLHMNVALAQNRIVSLGGISADELASAGVALPELPADLIATLTKAGAKQLSLQTTPAGLDVRLDNTTALTLNYDAETLAYALEIFGPFLSGTPLDDPVIMGFLVQQILPLVPGSDVAVRLNLN